MPGSFQFAVGPIEMFVKPRVNGTLHSSWLYFGTAVTAPEPEVRYNYHNVFNDLGGRLTPIQKVWDGEQHVVSATLNRFDYQVYNQLRTQLEPPVEVLEVGGENWLRGRLHIGYNDFQFLLVNSYADSVMDPGDMPYGRLYYSGTLLGARESTVGTRVQEISIMVECNGVFVPATRGFALFTEANTAWGSATPTVS